MKLTLHNYWRSSASHRVRIALNLKALPFHYVAVHILEKKQHSDEYLARNPMAQVPALEIAEDDGTTRSISQSLPIIEYLEERFEHATPLLPDDLYLRARVRGLAEIVNSGIQPLQNLSTTKQLVHAGVDDKAWVKHFIERGLAAFAKSAAETAGKFCVGDEVTIADCCLVPQLASARRFSADISGLSQLLAIEERCLAMPAFAAAMPDQQPDAVRS